MKRSFINSKIDEAIAFCNANKFYLPRWAYLPADKWAGIGEEADEIRKCGLGWDVTDFGSGDYYKVGLLAFTIRNGEIAGDDPLGKNYCEKLLISGEGQYTPTHFHWSKMEDIINRGGGKLEIQLWNGDPETEEIDTISDVTVSVDGIVKTLPAGGKLLLNPGESVTIPPYLYHNFCAAAGTGMILGGEVSRVNDDSNDNRFNPPLPRFSAIEEDEPQKYLLCNEY